MFKYNVLASQNLQVGDNVLEFSRKKIQDFPGSMGTLNKMLS